MSVTLNGTSGLVFSDGTIQGTAAGNSFRNRIINGDMRIDQRNAGAAVTPSTNAYTLDRWLANINVAGSRYSVQQSTSTPAGFTNSLLVTSTGAYSVVAADYSTIQTRLEAFNMADLGWGSSNAQPATLSFWVRSSLTGTFGGSLYVASSTARSYPYSYTITAANTWEYKTIVIPGDVFANTPATTNNLHTIVQWGIGVGSTFTTATAGWQNGNFASPTGCVNVLGTSGATFYITGVQLEKAGAATSFEHRPFGTELALCQRYYQVGDIHLLAANTSSGDGTVLLPVQMRANPGYTFTDSAGTANRYTDSAGSGLPLAVNANSVNTYRFRAQVALSRIAAWWEFNYRLSAEL